MKSLLFFLATLLVTAPAHAVCAANYCDDEQIERLWPTADGDLVIIISGDKSPLTCDLINGNRFELKPEKDPRGHMYALLVATQLADNTIGRIRLSDTGPCSVEYVWQDRSNITGN